MAEYLKNDVQTILLNNPLLFDNSLPCNRGYIYHENETGIFTLRGVTNNCFARYQVIFNGEMYLLLVLLLYLGDVVLAYQ